MSSLLYSQWRIILRVVTWNVFIGLGGLPVEAAISVNNLFSDHMVLQRSAKTPVWGTANAGELVRVTLGAITASTTADVSGYWRANLDLEQCAEGPLTLTVEGGNRIAIQDVLIGEVWFCSGQSNMDFALDRTIEARQEIAAATNSKIRQFHVLWSDQLSPASTLRGKWESCDLATAGRFSAVGYYFAKRLQRELGVPVGLIHSSWGGTPVESWTSYEGLSENVELKKKADDLLQAAKTFPERQRNFASAYVEWAKECGVAIELPKDVDTFCGESVIETDWKSVTLPGKVAASGLPDAGAVWLRKYVEIPATGAGKQATLAMESQFQFVTIYWNGQFIGGEIPENYLGRRDGRTFSAVRYYKIPPEMVKAGKNAMAIRLFSATGGLEIAPGGKFSIEAEGGTIYLDGSWLGRAEKVITVQDIARYSPVPVLKAAPRRGSVPSSLFNGMVAPVIPYGIRGCLWYQGEENADRGWAYRTAFPILIRDWRRQWNEPELPFYFCQLPNYHGKNSQPGESSWAELREAQGLALSLPHTGQAVLVDVGEADDIHPRNKQDVGSRLAAIALAQTYQKSVPFSGPVFDSMSIEGGKAILRFKNVEGGLVAMTLPEEYVVKGMPRLTRLLVRNSPHSLLEGFAICGADHRWFWADARIDGERVIVESSQVLEPVAVRYGWADNPTCNLANRAGFLASPFRTDSFPAITERNGF